jgi:predicted amidohydrolase YtcJ
MVVDDGVVGWVGSEGAADTAVGPGVRTEWLDGALVTPAFVDAHVHLTDTGLARSGVELSTCARAGDVLDAVQQAARSRPGLPVLGHGWDDTDWSDRTLPTRAELDRAAEGAVVYLSRVDVHSALVSSALVANDPGVERADGFDPSGPVSRQANHRLRQASRAGLSSSARRALQQQALTAAAAAGIGQVHEMGAPHTGGLDDLRLLLEWTQQAAVPDVVGYWGELGGIEAALDVGARGCAGDLCLDGSLGSRTAALRQPYADDPHSSGACYLSVEEAADHVLRCTDAGLQAGFHCIGDGAVARAVEAFGVVEQRRGRAAVLAGRHRLEHVELVDQDQIDALARFGVTASVQPAFDAAWGGPDGMYARRLGAERAAGLNPLATMARAGLTLALGSDSPVTPLDPWGTVRAAALHRTPEHRITARAAFAAHTRGGWRAAGVDGAGALVPGAPATFVVWDVPTELVVQAPDERVAAWSTDPRSGVPGLPDLSRDATLPHCRRTVVRGRVVHEDDTPGT